MLDHLPVLAKAIIWGAVLCLGIFSLLLAAVATGPQRYAPVVSDAIVVLGAAVWPGGRPSPALRGRAEKAAELYLAGYAGSVIASGGHSGSLPSEASVAAAILEGKGVPSTAIILEPQATSTEESARFVGEIVRQRGWGSVILVSDGYHLARSVWLFRRQGVRVSAAAADDWYYSTESRAYHMLRESAALGYLVVRELAGTVAAVPIRLTNTFKEP